MDQAWLADSLQDLTRELLADDSLRGLHLVINEENAVVQQLLREPLPAQGGDDVLCLLLLTACLHTRDVLTHDVAERLLGPLVRVLSSALHPALPALAAELASGGTYAIAG